MTVVVLPFPSTILVCQLLSCAAFTATIGHFQLVEVDAWELTKVKPFVVVALTFCASLFCNMNILKHTNVDTFIVARSCTPALVAICDYLFLDRELPTMQSWCAIAGIVLGAAGFVHYDEGSLNLSAWSWIISYLVVFVFDQIFIKWVCDTVTMTAWGRVFYTNTLASVPVAILAFATEYQQLSLVDWSSISAVLTMSCVCGISLSYFGFVLRDAVSATSFTIVGVGCKLFTVMLNMLIWKKHADANGTMCLLVALFASVAYEQSPRRQAPNIDASASIS